MKTLLTMVAAAIVVAAASAVSAHGDGPYVTLEAPQPIPGDGKIEVAEFF